MPDDVESRSKIADDNPPAPVMTLCKRFRLFVTVLAVVLVLSLLKTAIHSGGWEFLTLNALFSSAIAAAVFIIGFLLSSVLADYKEAERIPADMRVALEAVHDDSRSFARHSAFNADAVALTLLAVLAALSKALRRKSNDFRPVVQHIDALTTHFADMEQQGMPPNYVVRLRVEQSTLRRCAFRIYHMQRIQFVPSVHILVQTLVAAIMLLLLFLKTEGSPESALIFGAVSYMFTYALYLVDTLEQPFRKGRRSLDDVSLFLLREFEAKIRTRLAVE
jgi:hypothetical protein